MLYSVMPNVILLEAELLKTSERPHGQGIKTFTTLCNLCEKQLEIEIKLSRKKWTPIFVPPMLPSLGIQAL